MSDPRLESIVDRLSSLTVIEAAELAKMLEEKWGVSAAAPVAQTAAPVEVVEAAPEQSEFTVTLVNFGEKKVNVVREVRQITELGLSEAMALVNAVPSVLKADISKAQAEAIRDRIAAVGGTVEIK